MVAAMSEKMKRIPYIFIIFRFEVVEPSFVGTTFARYDFKGCCRQLIVKSRYLCGTRPMYVQSQRKVMERFRMEHEVISCTPAHETRRAAMIHIRRFKLRRVRRTDFFIKTTLTRIRVMQPFAYLQRLIQTIQLSGFLLLKHGRRNRFGWSRHDHANFR